MKLIVGANSFAQRGFGRDSCANEFAPTFVFFGSNIAPGRRSYENIQKSADMFVKVLFAEYFLHLFGQVFVCFVVEGI